MPLNQLRDLHLGHQRVFQPIQLLRPLPVAARVGVEHHMAVAQHRRFLRRQSVEASRRQPDEIAVDHAPYHRRLLPLHQGDRLVRVEPQQVLPEVALAQVKIGIRRVPPLQVAMHPVNAPMAVAHPLPGARVVLHHLARPHLAADIHLPEDHLFVARGTQRVVLHRLLYPVAREVFAEEPHEVRVEGSRGNQVFDGDEVAPLERALWGGGGVTRCFRR